MSGPLHGTAPLTLASRVDRQVSGGGKALAAHKPAAALYPAHGKVRSGASVPSRLAALGKVSFGVRAPVGPRHAGPGPLGIPSPSAVRGARKHRLTPSTSYSSKQLDSFGTSCGGGVNETTIAQSTTNPTLLVAGANVSYDNNGNCTDAHAGVFYSSDGGQHWHFEVMPNLSYPASGDPVLTFDPVRQVFVYGFIEFSRDSSGNAVAPGRIAVDVSSDGVNWSRDTTLSTTTTSIFNDKPSIAVDQNPSSPHYGRVNLTWAEFSGINPVYRNAYSDDGGQTWTYGDVQINFPAHECGNGSSSAYNANGELMVAWADCSGATYQMYEEPSPDGGATWPATSDTYIIGTDPIGDPAPGCFLNGGGTAFRCNSFPSLVGDPNPSDAGGTAFFITWSNKFSVTVGSTTATVAQIVGLSTVDDGATWANYHYVSANPTLGDKFFPAASFAPNGRLTISYSSRQDSATSTNPQGDSYNEYQTEADNLSTYNGGSGSYVYYVVDGTLGNPGTLTFIGDYSGNVSLDQNFDTFPIWTDVRNGIPDARAQDLCYADCMTFLSPDNPLFINRTAGSTFQDFYSFDMNPADGGSGLDYWNVVALREGSDGTSVDDDTFLSPNHYFNSSLTDSTFSPPLNDYTVVNGNVGGANTVYFQQVHSFSTVGGPYSIEWDAGHLILGTSRADSMGSSNVARVYDTLLNAGTTYHFGLRPAAGNTSNYNLNLHSGSRGTYQGRIDAAANTGDVAPGQPAFISYTTSSDPTQYDGVVVQNNNGGSGSYTLYRDTAAPSGTISIDGGATYTNSTTLNLTLSATNPTSGDPVSDMAFSIDGGAYGAFRPYATSATVTIPAGAGTHTMSVQYRNGAGVVSAAARSSIILDQTPPTTTASLSGNSTGCSTYYGTVTVTLTATDATSGVASTVYQIDGGAVHTYTAPFTVSGTANHTVTYHSTDHAGNVESTKSTSVSIVVAGLSSTPTSATPGSTATANGSKFKSGESVKIFWDSTSSTPLATPTASATCAVSASITVPAAVNGPHTLIAVGQTSGQSASSAFTVTAGEKLAPTSGKPGTSVTATLSGFKASQSVTLHWDTSTGPSLGTLTTSTTGGATKTFVVPSAVNGNHTVFAVGTGGTTATATFAVNANITLSPTSGTPAASVIATLRGYKASQSVTLRWDTTSGTVLATVTTNTTGAATATFHVPSSTVGTHHVLALATGIPTVSVPFSVT